MTREFDEKLDRLIDKAYNRMTGNEPPAPEGGRSHRSEMPIDTDTKIMHHLVHDDPPFERLNPPQVETESKPCEVFYRRAGSPQWFSLGGYKNVLAASDAMRFLAETPNAIDMNDERLITEVKVVVEVMRWERSY